MVTVLMVVSRKDENRQTIMPSECTSVFGEEGGGPKKREMRDEKRNQRARGRCSWFCNSECKQGRPVGDGQPLWVVQMSERQHRGGRSTELMRGKKGRRERKGRERRGKSNREKGVHIRGGPFPSHTPRSRCFYTWARSRHPRLRRKYTVYAQVFWFLLWSSDSSRPAVA